MTQLLIYMYHWLPLHQTRGFDPPQPTTLSNKYNIVTFHYRHLCWIKVVSCGSNSRTHWVCWSVCHTFQFQYYDITSESQIAWSWRHISLVYLCQYIYLHLSSPWNHIKTLHNQSFGYFYVCYVSYCPSYPSDKSSLSQFSPVQTFCCTISFICSFMA